jgi:hypothetical protein
MLKYSSVLMFLILSACVYHTLPQEEEPVKFVCEPTVSWQADILPIMTNSCAIVECHNGISRLDWRDYNKVKQYAASIKSKTQDKSMPFDVPLPQHEIDLIACWVDNGALDN